MREIKSALISGASGMIGATLTRLLLQNHIKVYALVRPCSKKIGNLPLGDPNLTVIACDLNRLPDLIVPGKELIPHVDAVFHFAWEGAFGEGRNNEPLQERNVRFTQYLVVLGKKLGARVFIGAGSQAEYGFVSGKLKEDTPLHPVTQYGMKKHKAAEIGRSIATKEGIDFIWTRILSVYGPYDNDYTLVMSAVNAFLKSEHIAFTKGEQIWDYLFSEDAAQCFYELAKSGKNGRTYVLGGGNEVPLGDYIRMIRDSVDPTKEIGFGERPYNENQVMYLSADISALREDTGYTPSTAFADGIEKTIRWAKERG